MFYTSDPRILVFSKNDKDTETKDTTRLSRIIPNLEIQMQQTSQLKLKLCSQLVLALQVEAILPEEEFVVEEEEW